MEPDIFTHIFDFQFKSVTVQGEIEFAQDGKTNMSLTQVGIPITAETMSQLLTLIEMIQKLTESGGEIKLLKVEKKTE